MLIRISAVMQLLKMFTFATAKDFKISLSIIGPDTDASGICACIQDTGQIKTYLSQTLNTIFTGSPCASLAHSLELMIEIQFST